MLTWILRVWWWLRGIYSISTSVSISIAFTDEYTHISNVIGSLTYKGELVVQRMSTLYSSPYTSELSSQTNTHLWCYRPMVLEGGPFHIYLYIPLKFVHKHMQPCFWCYRLTGLYWGTGSWGGSTYILSMSIWIVFADKYTFMML